jgi:hypothetical protein
MESVIQASDAELAAGIKERNVVEIDSESVLSAAYQTALSSSLL